MAHLTIQIGASIVIPMPTRLARSGRYRPRIAGARLRWQAIHEASLLDRQLRQDAWAGRGWQRTRSSGAPHGNTVSNQGGLS